MEKTDRQLRFEILQMLPPAFPWAEIPEATIVLFVTELDDVPPEELRVAVRSLIRTLDKYPPSLAQILKEITKARFEALGIPSAEEALNGYCETEMANQLYDAADRSAGLSHHMQHGMVADRKYVEARFRKAWDAIVAKLQVDMQAGREPDLLPPPEEEAPRVASGPNEGMQQIGEGVGLKRLLTEAKERSSGTE